MLKGLACLWGRQHNRCFPMGTGLNHAPKPRQKVFAAAFAFVVPGLADVCVSPPRFQAGLFVLVAAARQHYTLGPADRVAGIHRRPESPEFRALPHRSVFHPLALRVALGGVAYTRVSDDTRVPLDTPEFQESAAFLRFRRGQPLALERRNGSGMNDMRSSVCGIVGGNSV